MLLRWIGISGGLLLVLAGTPVAAQSSADAFFHDAAQWYVEGDREAARRAVERGLAVAPSDPRLRALKKKLTQQEKRQGGGRSSQQGAQNRQQRQKSRGQTAQQEQSGASGQENRTEGQAPSDEDASSPRRPDAQSQQPQPGEVERDAQGRGTRGMQVEDRRPRTTLSRAQAARILRALENQEMKLLREVEVRGQEGTTVEKDW
jgi:hypothetical protein